MFKLIVYLLFDFFVVFARIEIWKCWCRVPTSKIVSCIRCVSRPMLEKILRRLGGATPFFIGHSATNIGDTGCNLASGKGLLLFRILRLILVIKKWIPANAKMI